LPYYLLQITWSTEVARSLVENPADHMAALVPAAAKLGGSIDCAYSVFGDADFVGIVNMPDNVSMIAFSKAVSTSGASKSIRTTPLVTLEEEREAMRKAQDTGYRPPNA
jgi:uncharacterized protein with GYD domain